METTSYDPNGIIAGDHPLPHTPLTVASGEGVLPRGTVMGQVTLGAASAAAKSGGNTGNGTISPVTVLAGAKPGVYKLRFTGATTWTLQDPDDFNLGAGANGAANANDLAFTTTAGGTPHVAGDGWDITVAAGSGKAKKAVAAATDGSATPRAILAVDVDATSADVVSPGYRQGQFISENLTYGAGHNAASVEAAFRAANAGIYLKSIGAVA